MENGLAMAMVYGRVVAKVGLFVSPVQAQLQRDAETHRKRHGTAGGRTGGMTRK